MLQSLLLLATAAIATQPALARHGELQNRIPEAAPYNTEEASVHPPPYDDTFSGTGGPAICASCHPRIYREWNGSMMSNSWRDPVWRGAFLLLARLTATDGNCDVPEPPDGTPRASLNPFANDDCSSTFDTGRGSQTTRDSGSLLDDFCSRCHMPSNYIDNIPRDNVRTDEPSGLEHGLVQAGFDPTSARGGEFAFATEEGTSRNTQAGKAGITCTFCHTITESRHTPFHNYEKSGVEYVPDPDSESRTERPGHKHPEMFAVADDGARNLGYGIGAGAYRISPHAVHHPERFGPLAHEDVGRTDPYVSDVFDTNLAYQQGKFEVSIHQGAYNVLFERGEMCGQCHDVTNPLTIKNGVGRWVGGFPIERTYTEWVGSRYADRPGNSNFDASFKRDCQTCHMQQDYGQAGTAQSLYEGTRPAAPLEGATTIVTPKRPISYSHHFIGGNTYSTRLIGANTTTAGTSHPYPELSAASYSSADPSSPYHNAYFVGEASPPPTQHARMAWDRLRNCLSLELEGPTTASAGSSAQLRVRVTNSGAGHNFPTGFPEGRNAWVAVRAFDLATREELSIADAFWQRSSLGVGYLTDRDMPDPNFPHCDWNAPAGAPDPYAWQFRAVASLGDGCPTLALPYATPLNLVVNDEGMPTDAKGKVIDRANPMGLPRYQDLDADGDLYDDAFLIDTRLRPLPHPGGSVALDRYKVEIPEGTVGPVGVVAAVYYQSVEGVVAKKLLGNLADTDLDQILEPCVLKGACDGRTPRLEPAVVEGAPPVPMEVRNWIINLEGQIDTQAPTAAFYPRNAAQEVYADVVPKISFSEPVRGVDTKSFTLVDSDGLTVPADVEQIGDFTWALFPDQIFLEKGATYTARLSSPICDYNGNCGDSDLTWSFTLSPQPDGGTGDTRVALGSEDLFGARTMTEKSPPELTTSSVLGAAGAAAVLAVGVSGAALATVHSRR